MKTSQWYQRHQRDRYVQQARHDKYASRAAYKLIEIDQKTTLFQGIRHTILDLGAAPGGWSQVAAKRAPHAHIIAVDLLAMQPIPRVHLLKGDVFDPATWDAIAEHTNTQPVELMLSDMAANSSGISAVDNAQNQRISDLLLEKAPSVLSPQGVLVCKLFNGEAAQNMRKGISKRFKQHKILKPAASRSESSEIFLWAKGLQNAVLPQP